MVVIDWSDARLGDRHADVARTLALFWIAKIAATSRLERWLLTAARGRLRSGYLAGYRAEAPLDDARLRYWEALHTASGWAQLLELPYDTREAVPEMVSRIEPSLAAEVKRRFCRLTNSR
jgi:hypothetical protein